MTRDFRLQKRLIIAALVLLIAADVALAAYSWRMGSSSREQQALIEQTRELKLSQADVERAKGIKNSMPSIQADCDRFEHLLFPASTGYSSVTSDLDAIARKSAAQVQDLGFKQSEITARGLTAVEITATVSGNYSSVVHFVNGLQRSDSVYILEGLSIGGDSVSPGPAAVVKVTLHLQTYFRTAA